MQVVHRTHNYHSDMIFLPSESNRLNLYVSSLFLKGRKVKVEPVTVTKTLSQNAYAWLVFTHIGDQTGNTKDDIYRFCLEKWPKFKEIEISGEIHQIPITLSGMNKDQVSNFIDEFTTFFRIEGYAVPDPEDKKAVDMYQYYKERGL